MVHIDVKKLERIPDGGGWRAQPGQTRTNHTAGHVRVGKLHFPWTNGKVERFNRTLQAEWAYRQVFTSSA